MKLIVLFLALLHFINGQTYVPGKCPDVTPVFNIPIEKFAGDWHVINRVPEEIANGVICGQDHIEFVENNKFHGVFYAIVEKTNTSMTIPYVAKHKGDPDVVDLTVELNYNGLIKIEDVKIISGDLEKYALFWGCREEGPNSRRLVYLMGKTKTLSEDDLKKIKEDMERNKLDYSYLQLYNKENCPN